MPLTINTQGVQQAIRQVEARFHALRWGSWLRAEQRSLEAQHARYFDAQRGPDGAPWKPNAPATVKRKGHTRRLHGIPWRGFPLRQSLTLPTSQFGIRYEIDEWPSICRIVFGTDAPYHVYNQDGTRHIPARRHLGISRTYLQKMTQRATQRAALGCKVTN